MPKVVVEVADGFSAFGVDYTVGQIVADSEFAKWPEGTVERRLTSGFLKHKVVPDTPKPDVDLSDLEALNSDELIEVAAKFGAVLDEDLDDEEKIRRIHILAKA